MSTTPEFQLMTPETAGHILATCKFPRQRRVRAAWVNELAEIICAGSWQTTTITLCECAEDGKTYLVDGYHRLNAILSASVAAPLIVYRESVDTLKEVGIIYSRLDRGMPRNVIDGLVARDLPAETDLPATVLRAGVAAVNVIRSGFRHDSALANKRGYDEKFKDVTEWLPELRLYTAAVADGNRTTTRRLYSAAILAVGLTIFRDQPEKAHDFFRNIARSTNITDGSAMQMFVSKLLDDEQNVRVLGTSKMCRYTAVCWNAHFKGEPLETVRVYDTAKSIIILGTSHTHHKSR